MSGTISRAIALGISADTTVLQREMRQVHSILAQVREPAERLRIQQQLLADQFTHGEVTARQYSDALAKMGENADKQAAKLAKLRTEASAWSAGMANLGKSAIAPGIARDNSGREAYNAGMRNVQRTNDAAEATAMAARNQLTAEGTRYMRQFEGSAQRLNRQLAEAAAMFRRGAISANEYAGAMRNIRSQHSIVGQSLRSLRGTFASMIGVVTIAYGTFNFLRTSVKLAADLEATRAKMIVLTGSVTQANEQLLELRELSSRGISFSGGQQSVAVMLQFGVASNSVIASLRQIGEITGGDSERMKMLSLAFAQTNAAGRLMGQDLLQMVNAGFNPLKVISDQTGESLVELKKQMSEGSISSERVAQAFRDATAEGGRFHGLLDQIAGTAAGKFTRARTEVEKFETAIGQMLTANKGLIDLFIEDVGRLTRSVEALSSMKLPSWLGGSGLTSALTTAPGIELLKAPSYIADIMAARADVDPNAGKLTLPLSSVLRLPSGSSSRVSVATSGTTLPSLLKST